ncbi:hypothetical protein [Kitasatospora sp. NPDC097643]|uniref:hypothetical protein n=1 Tax=Kitasatospora sp. NPDC097643 TaxID=3157230 RepID=UPI003322B6A2
MGMVAGRRVAAGVAVGVLVGVLAGCSSSGSEQAKGAAASSSTTAGAAGAAGGAAATAPAAGSATATAPGSGAGTPAAPGVASASAPAAGGTGGTGSTGGGSTPAPGGTAAADAPAPRADSEATLLDDKVVAQVLPDPKVMAGWEEEKRKVDTADHTVTCTAKTPCTGKPLSGSVRFSSGDLVTRFIVETLPSRDAAKDRLKETYASYAAGPFTAVDTAALGSESKAFQGKLAASDGVGIVIRSGTVVASVTTEGGPVDVAATRKFAVMLVKRIEQAQNGKTPDAGLGVG